MNETATETPLGIEHERPRAFLSIKFESGGSNRKHGETLIGALEEAGLEVFCLVRDEGWGLRPHENPVREAYRLIDQSDFLIFDASGTTGFGMGTEVGYANARGKPVILLCPEEKVLEKTREDATDIIIRFKNPKDLVEKLEATIQGLKTRK